MDAKIKKYALYLKICAWILIVMHVFQWILKWTADWVAYVMTKCPTSDIYMPKCTSLAEAFEKASDKQLSGLKLIDAAFGADYGSSYFGGSWHGGSWLGLEHLAKLSWTSRLLGFLCDGISIAILTVGFWFFIKLMTQFKKGSIFSIDVSDLLNRLAKVIFWFALYAPINRALVTLIMTLQNSPGQRLFIPSIPLADCFIFAASYFFMILTSLMHESRKLQEDRDLTV